MQKMLFAILLMISYQTDAGFISGMVAGATLSSSSNSKTSSSSNLIMSDKFDVIACHHTSSVKNSNLCKVELKFYDANLQCSCITVEQFALKAGYSKVHKLAVQFQDTEQFIIMEVEK